MDSNFLHVKCGMGRICCAYMCVCVCVCGTTINAMTVAFNIISFFALSISLSFYVGSLFPSKRFVGLMLISVSSISLEIRTQRANGMHFCFTKSNDAMRAEDLVFLSFFGVAVAIFLPCRLNQPPWEWANAWNIEIIDSSSCARCNQNRRLDVDSKLHRRNMQRCVCEMQ